MGPRGDAGFLRGGEEVHRDLKLGDVGRMAHLRRTLYGSFRKGTTDEHELGQASG